VILTPGDTVERYRVVRVLGQGGMSVVYEVVHTRLGTSHALKVLTVGGPAMEQRLLSEGRIQAQLRHPHVVPVTDVIDVGETLGLVMDLVAGTSLAAVLRAERLSLEAIDHLALQILDGVAVAHEAGVVHRDLKPGNILVEVVGEPGTPGAAVVAKVADFGLVHVLGDPTRPTVAGTLRYMAPEQLLGARIDARADVFALGAVLFELLSGQRAFPGDDPEALAHRVKRGQVAELPRERVVPGRMVRALRQALSRDPAKRPATAAALARRWLDGSVPAEPVWPAVQLRRIRGLLDTQSAEVTQTVTVSVSPPPTSPAR